MAPCQPSCVLQSSGFIYLEAGPTTLALACQRRRQLEWPSLAQPPRQENSVSCRSLVVLAIAGLLVGAAALGLLALKTGPRSRPQPGGATLVAAVEDIEAGRMSTPLVSRAHGGSGFTVTFLAKRLGGEAPRIVSDITGWGEHVDGTFDSTAGTMARVGQNGLVLAPGAGLTRCARRVSHRVRPDRLSPRSAQPAAQRGPGVRRPSRVRVRVARLRAAPGVRRSAGVAGRTHFGSDRREPRRSGGRHASSSTRRRVTRRIAAIPWPRFWTCARPRCHAFSTG